MSPQVRSLPAHLRPYLSQQNYDSYTAEEQATWRYIMRRALAFFAQHGHPSYLDGIKKTGISIDHIPRVENIDEALSRFGWGAVAVRGFIPPQAFLELQSRSILPIAVDMRSLKNLAYTPAPDIVHEAAGHAPMLVNPEYRAYLERYALLAQHAIFSAGDLALFGAIRALSDMKENADYKAGDINTAQKTLDSISQGLEHQASEAAQIARLYWWTAEYGLIGTVDQFKIYGAGLLSSVGESSQSLNPKVEKRPLTLNCVKQAFDITRPQPQLYVARDFAELSAVLTQLEQTMAFRRGGAYGLEKLKEARALGTVVLDGGLSLSGLLDHFLIDDRGQLSFIRFKGPTQLAKGKKGVLGHGSDYHAHGYSSPLGRLKSMPDLDPAHLKPEDVERLGIRGGQKLRLEYQSGFVLEGSTKKLHLSQEGSLEILSLGGAKLSLGEELYFDPSWGDFDVVFGSKALSVYGGPADYEGFGTQSLGELKTTPRRTSAYTPVELNRIGLFKELSELRRGVSTKTLDSFTEALLQEKELNWLIALETEELWRQAKNPDTPSRKALALKLAKLCLPTDTNDHELLVEGLRLIP